MGKTVESFSIALEGEISRLSGFARDSSDREAFDELLDMCMSFASAVSNANNPILFESFVVSAILG